MNIEKEIKAFTASFAALLAAIAVSAVGASEPTEEEEEKPKPKPKPKAKAEEEETEDDEEEEADEEEDADDEEDADEEDAPDNVKDAVAKMIENDKRDEAVAILKKFGAKAVADVPKDKQAKCLKLLLAELA